MGWFLYERMDWFLYVLKELKVYLFFLTFLGFIVRCFNRQFFLSFKYRLLVIEYLLPSPFSTYPVNINLFKVNNRYARERCQICSKLAIKSVFLLLALSK